MGTADDAAMVFVPPGAVGSTTVEVSVTDVGKDALPGTDVLLTSVFELAPGGTQFDRPVVISIALPAGSAKDTPAALMLFNDTTNAWEEVPGSFVMNGRVFGQTTHFSSYSVGTPADSSDLCLFRNAVAPLVAPASIVIANATKLDTFDAFAGADRMELGSRWEAQKRTVTVSGLAGPPSGAGGWTVFGTMGQGTGTFDIASDGSFSFDIDVGMKGPWFGFTDACLQPYTSGSVGWLYNLEIACGPDCQADTGGGGGTNLPECSSFPATVAMEQKTGFSQATLVFVPGTSCALEAPQTTFPGGIFNFRVTDGGGDRAVAVIAGASSWEIHDISAGTLVNVGQANSIPDGVDITMGINPTGQAGPTHVFTFRFDGTNVTAISLSQN